MAAALGAIADRVDNPSDIDADSPAIVLGEDVTEACGNPGAYFDALETAGYTKD